jgi:DNA-binding MarR family transcriptional regulator
MTRKTNESNIDPFEAMDFIRDNASEYGARKAYMTYMMEKRKTVKAMLMRSSLDKTETAKESYAYSHPDYMKHLDEMRDAIAEFETLRMLIVGAEAKIEAWRSLEATARTEHKLTI